MSIAGYAGAGAWGASVIPGAIRRGLDTERLPVMLGVLLAELVTLACFASVPIALVVVETDIGRTGRWVLLATFLACCIGGGIWVAEAIARIVWCVRRPGRAVVGIAPSGAPSTAVLRSRLSLVTPWVAGLLTVAWAAAMVVVTRENPWVAAGFAVVALACATRVVPLVTGRAVAGGIHLTPQGLELSWGVTTTRIPWDEVRWAQWAPPAELFVRSPSTTATRSFPVDMPSDVVDHVRRGSIRTPVPYLAVRLPELHALVELGRTSPHLREHFGTPDVLEWHVEPPSSAIG